AERQRALMACDRVALVVRQHKETLELGERADAPPSLPAPVVPLGKLGLGEIALAEGARRPPDPKAAKPRRERAKAMGRDGQGRIDATMRFGEECGCRVATGRLFRLAVNQFHRTEIPPAFADGPDANRQVACPSKSASYFSDSSIDFKR